jgi:hypothetical protein
LERIWKEEAAASAHLPGHTEDNHEKPHSEQSACGLDLNLGLSEYEEGILSI